MEKRKMGLLILATALAVAVLWLLFSGDETKEGAGRTAEQQAEEEALQKGDGEQDQNLARMRVEREGKILEGWSESPGIVLDAGHGGFDPGKMGVNNVPEKEVNLKIAGMVKEFLEASGVRVTMTRQEDRALCEDAQDNKKVRDLKQRISVIEGAAPIAAVSIHQNSYPQESVHGAQVFYYGGSAEGQSLAECIQQRLILEADPENDRQVKDNTSYYLLKKTAVPLVIVECGFLSNWEEAEKLCSPEYQETVAWAVYLGIMDYLELSEPKSVTTKDRSEFSRQ